MAAGSEGEGVGFGFGSGSGSGSGGGGRLAPQAARVNSNKRVYLNSDFPIKAIHFPDHFG